MIDPDRVFEEALQYHQLGDLTNARSCYERVLAADPKNATLWRVLGLVRYQLGDLDEAETHLRSAIALNGDDAVYFSNLGSILNAQGRVTNAVESFHRAIELQPGFEDARNNLANAYVRLGRTLEAEEIFRKLLADNPDRAEVCNNLGSLLFRQGNKSEAEDLLRKALDMRPDYTDALVSLANVYLESGELELAAECLQKVEHYRPNDSQVLRMCAQVSRLRDDLGSALAYAKRAVAEVSDDARNHVALGVVLQALGRPDKAEAAYQKALALDPRDADAVNNLGTIFKESDEDGRALRCFQSAIERREGFADAHYNLGTVLQDIGDVGQATQAFEQALALRPTLTLAYRCLTDIHHATGEATKALDVLKRWLDYEPNNSIALHRLAAVQTCNTPDRAPDAYVRDEFDHFADGFDKTLAKLKYCAPQKILECLDRHVHENLANVLDAGCGTGLAADALRRICETLDGVDLSPKMIEYADGRNLYDSLVVDELVACLDRRRACYDLIFSADTLVYFGELKPLFATAKRSLRRTGYLAFSVEHLVTGTYRLNASGRYSHTEDYLTSSLHDAGFAVVDVRREVLREELLCPVDGLVVLAQARGVSIEGG